MESHGFYSGNSTFLVVPPKKSTQSKRTEQLFILLTTVEAITTMLVFKPQTDKLCLLEALMDFV